MVATLLAGATVLGGCSAETDPHAAFERGEYGRALRLWRVEARAGDPVAQNYLGIHYELGLAVERDPAQAAAWYRRAARQGHPDAQRNLGTLYQFGRGVPQDRLRAYGWYHYAAARGSRTAQDYILSMTGELTANQIMQARALIGRELAEAGARRPKRSPQP